MKRMKRVLALGMAVLMCMGLTACGKDFDAAGYTKSVLDANYHAQYDKYAEYRGISESDAKKEVTEGMRTQIESAFSGMDVSDEMMDKYIEVADKAYDLADFTVKDAKKQDVACLFDLKVIPKTMTDGYESWWDVGIATTSEKYCNRVCRSGKRSDTDRCAYGYFS